MPASKHRRKNTTAQSKKVNRDKHGQHGLKGIMARRAKEVRQQRLQQSPATVDELFSRMGFSALPS